VDARRSSSGKFQRGTISTLLSLSSSRFHPVFLCEQVFKLVHVTALNLPVSYVERDGVLEKLSTPFRRSRRQMGDLKNIRRIPGNRRCLAGCVTARASAGVISGRRIFRCPCRTASATAAIRFNYVIFSSVKKEGNEKDVYICRERDREREREREREKEMETKTSRAAMHPRART